MKDWDWVVVESGLRIVLGWAWVWAWVCDRVFAFGSGFELVAGFRIGASVRL